METENQVNASEAQGEPVPFTPEGSATDNTQSQPVTEVAYNDAGWSWGAFALNFMFIIAIRRYMYLFFLLLMFVPFVNFIAMIGMMIYFGSTGRELARTSTTFSNKEQYLGFMKGIDHAGKIIAYFYIIIFAIGIAAAIVLMSLSGARDRAQDAYYESQMQNYELEQRMMEEEMDYYQ